MFDISLDSRRVVSVDSLYVSDTYSGVLEGKRDVAMSAHIVESAATKTVGVWGQRPTYVVSPAGERGAPLPEHLPHECWCAWLTSAPIHDDSFGSQLVVVWFQDAASALSLRDIITAGVRAVPWESVAEDYDF